MRINVSEEVPVKIRDAMVPSPGYLWVSCDYSQLEYRMMTNLAMDEHLVKMFEDGVDFHTATASMMMNVPPEQVDKKMRKLGKCVTGDTRIYSPSHGIVRIDEVSDFREEDQFIDLDDFYVINMDGKHVQATQFYYGGVRKVTNIITRYGFKLGGSTDKHRIIVLDEKGFPVYKKMSELTTDDYVVLYIGGFEKETDEYVKFPLKEEWFYHYSQDHPGETAREQDVLNVLKEVSGYRNDAAKLLGVSEGYVQQIASKYNVPPGIKMRPEKFMLSDVTEEVAEFWGMMLSDGHFNGSGDALDFGSADRENIDRFVYLVKHLWPAYEPSIDYRPTKNGVDFWLVRVHSHFICEQFTYTCCDLGNKSSTMRVPPEIMQSKTSVKVAFLAGWFNGDGCFTEKETNTCSVSKQFIYDLQSLFGSLGILTKVWSETPTIMKGTDYLAWKLALVDDYAHKKFYDLVYSYLIDRKKIKFDACIERFNTNKSCLQVAYNLKETVRDAMPGLTLEQRKGKYRYLNKGVNSFGYACMKELYLSESITLESKALLGQYLDRKIIAVPIKEIYETEEPVYDFCVPDGHQFISEQQVSSNTINFGISFGMTASGLARSLGCSKQEAEDKQRQYFQKIPKIKVLIDQTKATTKARGYSRTFMGRMRPFKKQLENAAGNWYKEDNALMTSFNTTVQGSAADFAKIALARCYEAIKPYGERVRMLTQVHDEINFEVQCVNPDGSIDSDFLAEVLRTIDYGMSYRKIYPGWADIPADIEIGWNYGALKGSDPHHNLENDDIYKEFGVDVLAIQESQPPTDLPKWLFENLNYDVINKTDLREAQKEIKKNTPKSKSTGSKQASSDSSGENAANTETGPSRGQEMAKRMEQKMMSGGKIEGRLDLPEEPFNTSTVLLYLKPGTNDQAAFDLLKEHIQNNFGTYDIVLEHEGVLYKLHDDYRINANVDALRECFEVDIFDVRPKVVIENVGG